MAQSHKRQNKRPSFSNGVKWANMQKANLELLKRLSNDKLGPDVSDNKEKLTDNQDLSMEDNSLTMEMKAGGYEYERWEQRARKLMMMTL